MASLGSLFASPTQQAQTASSGVQNADNNEIAQQQNYVQGQEQQLRGAIGSLGPNPYFTAAGKMSPAGYAVNPNDTQTFNQATPQATGVSQARPVPASPPPTVPRNPFAPQQGNPFGLQPRSAAPVMAAPQRAQ